MTDPKDLYTPWCAIFIGSIIGSTVGQVIWRVVLSYLDAKP